METRQAIGQAMGGEDRVAGILKDILPADRSMDRRTIDAVTNAVYSSYSTDRIIRPPTQAETKERSDRVCRGIADMVRDLHWPLPKALDYATKYLRASLDGIDFIAQCRSDGLLWPEEEELRRDPAVDALVR